MPYQHMDSLKDLKTGIKALEMAHKDVEKAKKSTKGPDAELWEAERERLSGLLEERKAAYKSVKSVSAHNFRLGYKDETKRPTQEAVEADIEKHVKVDNGKAQEWRAEHYNYARDNVHEARGTNGREHHERGPRADHGKKSDRRNGENREPRHRGGKHRGNGAHPRGASLDIRDVLVADASLAEALAPEKTPKADISQPKQPATGRS